MPNNVYRIRFLFKRDDEQRICGELMAVASASAPQRSVSYSPLVSLTFEASPEALANGLNGRVRPTAVPIGMWSAMTPRAAAHGAIISGSSTVMHEQLRADLPGPLVATPGSPTACARPLTPASRAATVYALLGAALCFSKSS